MGPRRCGRGKYAKVRGLDTRVHRFNGAATLWSRKASVRMNRPSASPKLQWGRDAVVAEREHRQVLVNVLQSLQWGRDAVVAESGRAFLHVVKEFQLQWGRDAVVAERQRPLASISASRLLQWGRDAVVAERTFPAWGAHAIRSSFNGAATLWSRKEPVEHRPTAHLPASMGPRRCGRGKTKFFGIVVADGSASMGPRRCGRGKSVDFWFIVLKTYRFNGAATLWSRKAFR